MKTVLGIILGGFMGFLLGFGDIAHYYQWEFYAIIVPFAVVLVIYGRWGR